LELTFDHPVEIRKQWAHEEGEEPEFEERTTRVLNLTAGFGLIEVGFKVSEFVNWRQQASVNHEARSYEDDGLLAMRRF
jgi:hypothetical protein